MTVHKLSAGDGYTYLTRQVASADVARRRGQELADYYTASGNPPGRWMGSGIVALGVSGLVSEAQMKALFGAGIHPDAERITAEGQLTDAANAGRRLRALGGTRARGDLPGVDGKPAVDSQTPLPWLSAVSSDLQPAWRTYLATAAR